MSSVIDTIMTALLIVACASCIMNVAVFWIVVIGKMVDGFFGNAPTEKEIKDKTH